VQFFLKSDTYEYAYSIHSRSFLVHRCTAAALYIFSKCQVQGNDERRPLLNALRLRTSYIKQHTSGSIPSESNLASWLGDGRIDPGPPDQLPILPILVCPIHLQASFVFMRTVTPASLLL
jgi:hypothetical protein